MSEPAPAAAQTEATPWTEAVHSGRCPVCYLLRRDEFDELRRWVGGDVADDRNRLRLDEAGGFCNCHFWLLAELHSPQSGSCVNDYLVTRLIERLRDPARQDWREQAAWLREAASRCPLCARLRTCETTHVRAFLGWLSDGVAWPQYAESRGFCLPHLLRCQALVQDQSLREQLNRAQAAQTERLQREMRELARKLAAGRRREVSRDEWVAWARATEKFVGRRGLAPP
jgi:hypothetical protein